MHIVKDEKFLDAAFQQFEEVVPGANTYILPENKLPIRYLKAFQPIRISKWAFLDRSFIKSLEEYDAVILHSMTDFALALLIRASANVKFVWIGMGYDYYDLIYTDPSDMLESETLNVVKKVLPEYRRKRASKLLRQILKRILYTKGKSKEALIQRVELFCPVLLSESGILENKLGRFWPKSVAWNYGAQSFVIDSDDPSETSCVNILVGNSATPTNNHLEVFNILRNISLPPDCKVIVPLSYGDTRYRNEILRLGEDILGGNFYPILEFLDFKDYSELIKTCSVVIMNHRRQQGAGNVTLGLYFGAKVFLNSVSPLFEFYKDKGFIIYSVEELKSELEQGINSLSKELAAMNRNSLKRDRSRRAHLDKTQSLINEIVGLR